MALHPEHLQTLVEHWRDWPSTMIEIADQIEGQLLRTSAETAKQKSREIVMTISWYFGGQAIYFPAASVVEAAIRREKVAEAIESGEATRQIIDEHGITDRTVRRYKRRGRTPKS